MTTENSLEKQVVALLTQHGKTVATAESCTGGMIAACLTGVPGSSRVFGTGIVSYSVACKQELLGVDPALLKAEGTVCTGVAEQMARGVRKASGADIGVAVTGEAGPNPAEAVPVGTVFVALADNRRTWVWDLHLTGDREAIRRQATEAVLTLLLRYLEAYPTVMAGGVSNREATARPVIPRTQGEPHPPLHARLLPWKGDSLRAVLVKCLVWLLVFAVFAGTVFMGYRYLVAPAHNRQLQDELGDLYWGTPGADTGDSAGSPYPAWLLPQFRGLYEINPYVAGWIQIPDTNVDYPVMFNRDGYYGNHNFHDEYSTYGQPYFSENTLLEDDSPYRSMTVYGKSTGDGQMFSDLLNYRRVAFLQEHATLEMNTVTKAGRWEIFAVVVADEENREECDYSRTDFADEADFAAHIALLQERSLFYSSLTVTPRDELLLLSVNTEDVYDYAAARLVIAARRMTGQESTATYRVNPRAKLPEALMAQEDRNDRDDPITTRSTRPATTTATTVVTTTATTTTTGTVTQATTVTTTTAESTTVTVVETTTTATVATDSGETEQENDDHIGN